MATWTLIGAGRIGGALQARAAQKQRPIAVLGRHDDWRVLDAPSGAPIVVCTRNDDLPAVLARVPQARHGDLVFVQNGMLRPWLAANGLFQSAASLGFTAADLERVADYTVKTYGDAKSIDALGPITRDDIIAILADTARQDLPL